MTERICSRPLCQEPLYAKTVCRKHYRRLRLYGHPAKGAPRGGRKSVPAVERFWSFIDRTPDGCWTWQGSHDPSGYGSFVGEHGVLVKSHRYSYELLVEPIPEGLHLDHLCRNPPCCNPSHLEPVTCLENVRRGQGHVSKTHCPQGHPYEGENLRFHKGRRHCRTCGIDRARHWREARKNEAA
jgi:hypothetical protein